MVNQTDFEKGREIRQQLFGQRPSATGPSSMAQLAPDFADTVTEVVFGRTWGDPRLEIKLRSVAVISALIALQRLPQLKTHIMNGLNVGLTKEEIIEIIKQMAFYCGLPAAVNAFETAKAAFEESERK
ncbi:MAG: carboxymuconolactone decarboxylase family protein [Candidatus Tectomicrobia bacterium]|nr:carboxymuconolactone decarboxylase family protein [Candidatus Tectomicrobia bacterium]